MGRVLRLWALDLGHREVFSQLQAQVDCEDLGLRTQPTILTAAAQLGRSLKAGGLGLDKGIVASAGALRTCTYASGLRT